MELPNLSIPSSVELPSIDDPARWLMEQQVALYNEQSAPANGYECEICRNKGFIDVIRDGVIIRAECVCQQARATLRRAKQSGLSGMLADCTFDRFQTPEPWQQEIKAQAERYAECPEGWLYICGQVGSGKTHLCTAVVGRLLKRGMSARYMMWRDESVSLKATINDPDYGWRMDDYKQADVLYIDDLFKGGCNEADKRLAFELINNRYNARRITIISSELSVEDVIALDAAIGTRIYQLAKGNVIQIGQSPDRCWRCKG